MLDHSVHIENCSDFLHSNYDCCLYTLGYEQRSTYIAKHHKGKATRRIALGYRDFQLFSYQENKAWYTGNGFEVIECSDSDFRKQIEQIVAEVAGYSQAALRVLVDISSMNRFRLASLIDAFRSAQLIGTIRVDFVYCLAAYSPPPNLNFVNKHVGPMSPQFSGWWTEPDRPTAAIVGVGYEQDKALGAIEHVQPSEVWLFFPRSPVAEYTPALNYANRSLVENVKRERGKILQYDVDEPYALFANLESLVAGLSSRANCILLPFGPKLFALSSLLVACVHRETAVWRVSGAEQPTDRIGHSAYGLSVAFCTADQPVLEVAHQI
jgi:hypothetical protein